MANAVPSENSPDITIYLIDIIELTNKLYRGRNYMLLKPCIGYGQDIDVLCKMIKTVNQNKKTQLSLPV
jgi:hypothetical protein